MKGLIITDNMKYRYICGVDLETANLETDPEKNRILEIGAVLFDVVLQKPLEIHNVLIKPYNDIPIDPDGARKHGITDEVLEAVGLPLLIASNAAIGQRIVPDAFMAHNASFDKPLLMSAGLSSPYAGIPWIDTMYDIPFPDDIKTRNLTHLAAEHGFVNPFPHRAASDVLTMVRIAAHYLADEDAVDAVMESAMSPVVDVIAVVNYDNRQKAKDHKFMWDPTRKEWYKRIKECKYDPEHYDFKTRVLRDITRTTT